MILVMKWNRWVIYGQCVDLKHVFRECIYQISRKIIQLWFLQWIAWPNILFHLVLILKLKASFPKYGDAWNTPNNPGSFETGNEVFLSMPCGFLWPCNMFHSCSFPDIPVDYSVCPHSWRRSSTTKKLLVQTPSWYVCWTPGHKLDSRTKIWIFWKCPFWNSLVHRTSLAIRRTLTWDL